jgi:hypothetical protein
MPRSLCVWVCVALALLVPVSGAGVAASRAVASAEVSGSDRASIAPAATPRFRLGDAARPFGWSTAIGDFNTDGTLDVAVADHVGRWASEYMYRIELSISGQPSRDVTFESTHEAVSIRLSDVDRDNDLDIVVGVPLSAETVGVWLNDGHGHFTASDMRRFPASLQAQQTLDARDAVADVAAFEPSPRRLDLSLSLVSRAPPSLASHRIVASDRSHSLSSLAALHASPRAPPSSSAA